MTKLTKHVSKQEPTTLVINGLDLVLERLSLAKIIELEATGEDLSQMMQNFQTKPATISSKICWLLLDAKSKMIFKNDFSVFASNIFMQDINNITTAIVKIVEDSQPVIKNGVGLQ